MISNKSTITPRTLLGWAILLCSLYRAVDASTITNMFEYTSSPAYNGKVWGRYCYSYSEYRPLDGWTMVVTSSEPLTDITVYTATKTKIDDYTFHIYPVFYNQDLTLYQGTCASIELRGSFGADAPDIVTASFYCVSLTHGSACEIVPYLTVDDLLPTTPGIPPLLGGLPLLVTIAPTAVGASSATAAGSPVPDPTPQWSRPSSGHLQKVKGKCYVGTQVVATSGLVKSVESCAVICLEVYQECSGVNYVEGDSLCSPVWEKDWNNAGLLTTVSGCEFWKLHGKS